MQDNKYLRLESEGERIMRRRKKGLSGPAGGSFCIGLPSP